MQLEMEPLWSSCRAARGITRQTGNVILGDFREPGLISTCHEDGQQELKFVLDCFVSFLWSAVCTRRQ